MAGNTEYYEFLNAYSLGCLDSEDLVKLKSYLAEGGEFPWQELGEFQNLSSLLPSILTIESPAPEVKDDVARKLYRIKSEIKAKREKLKVQVPPAETAVKISEPEKTEDKKAEMSEDYERVSPLRKSDDIPDEEADEVSAENQLERSTASEDEIDTLSDSVEESAGSTAEPVKKTDYFEKKYSKEPGKKKISGFSLILLLVIVVVGILLVYLKVTADVNNYQNRIVKLKKEVNDLTQKFNQFSQFQAILTSKDLKIINLETTGRVKEAFGKLFISPESSAGFLKVSDLPELKGNNLYRIWLNLDGKFYSLTTFQRTGKLDFVSFELPNIVNSRRVRFEVTGGTVGGADRPGKAVFLKGSI